MVRLGGITSINIRKFLKTKKFIFLVYCKPKLFFLSALSNILSAPYARKRVDFLGNQ